MPDFKDVMTSSERRIIRSLLHSHLACGETASEKS